MPTNQPRTPYRYIDADGQPIVRVPLARRPGLGAELDATDFDALCAVGVSENWSLNFPNMGARGYIQCNLATHYRNKHGPRTMLGVARLITRAGPGQQVRYRDNNTANLRRSNLILVDGPATRELIEFVPFHSEEV